MPSCFKTRKLSTFCSISSGSARAPRGRDLLRQTEGLPALELVRVDFAVVEQALQIPQRVRVEGVGAHQREAMGVSAACGGPASAI